MSDKEPTNENLFNNLTTTGFGYDLLRYICLPDLLGKDSPTILYVMGKNLARKLRVDNLDELIQFFNQAGWGELTLIKEKRKELVFELTGRLVTKRMELDIDHDYRLEAGFLAQSVQQLKDLSCECIDESNVKKGLVQFHVLVSK